MWEGGYFLIFRLVLSFFFWIDLVYFFGVFIFNEIFWGSFIIFICCIGMWVEG